LAGTDVVRMLVVEVGVAVELLEDPPAPLVEVGVAAVAPTPPPPSPRAEGSPLAGEPESAPSDVSPVVENDVDTAPLVSVVAPPNVAGGGAKNDVSAVDGGATDGVETKPKVAGGGVTKAGEEAAGGDGTKAGGGAAEGEVIGTRTA